MMDPLAAVGVGVEDRQSQASGVEAAEGVRP